jgi:predicted acylesterase/phospholipase RssA
MKTRPKIGLALSGASGRAIAHIGVLEVLQENGIEIDYLTACSSGTVIAASFACGTMQQLKRDFLQLNKRFLLEIFSLEKTVGGVFSMNGFASWFGKYTHGKKFEDVKPRLGFVCVDINTGEPMLLALGDMVKAGQASCTVPGLFEPVEWGNKFLVDGGLFSIVPTTQAKEMGADFVIGVDIAATRYLFPHGLHGLRKGYKLLKDSFPARLYGMLHEFIDSLFSKSVNFIFYNQSDFLDQSKLPRPGMFSVLGKAMDIAMARYEKQSGLISDCDYLISPNIKHFGKTDFVNAKLMIEESRRATKAAIPEIKKLLRDYKWRRQEEKFKNA